MQHQSDVREFGCKPAHPLYTRKWTQHQITLAAVVLVLRGLFCSKERMWGRFRMTLRRHVNSDLRRLCNSYVAEKASSSFLMKSSPDIDTFKTLRITILLSQHWCY